jgi:hypothetical protein
MSVAEEIVPAEVRQSAIISHPIGIPDLAQLLNTVPAFALAHGCCDACSRTGADPHPRPRIS